MPTRKRHQQLQRAQEQQLLQQQQQQQPLQHDKQSNNNNLDTTNGNCPTQLDQLSKQQISKIQVKAEVTENDVKPLCVQNDKSIVQKDIQALLESDLYCAICREIYIDPLILNCAHSFCKFCLNHWLSKQVACPTCRMVVVFQTENLALKDIVNKLVRTSSPEFQLERAQSLDQRSKAEQQQKARGVQPLMEKKSFNANGEARRKVSEVYKGNFIRPWRGPNGATIWETRLDHSDEVLRPRRVDDSFMFTSSSEDENEEDEDDDEEDDSDIGRLNPIIDLLGEEDTDSEWVDEHGDESDASTIDIDSSDDSESYVISRRRQMDDLNILAGILPADSDEDFEVSEVSHSESDSSMQGVEEDVDENDSSESIDSPSEIFGPYRGNRLSRIAVSTDDENEEVEHVDGDIEQPFDSDSSDDSSSHVSDATDNSADISYMTEEESSDEDESPDEDDDSSDEAESSEY